MSEYIDWGSLTKKQRNHLIAEKVMGLEVKACEGGIGEQANSPDGWYCLKCGYEGYWGDTYDHEEIPQPYTTSMSAAWQIVEKRGATTVLTYHPARIGDDSTCSACYSCEMGEEDVYSGMFHPARAYAETAAEAVCIAALRHAGMHMINTTKEQLTAYQVTFEDGTHMISQEKEHAMEAYHQREQYLKDNLLWARNICKFRMEEVLVPADYFDGGIEMA